MPTTGNTEPICHGILPMELITHGTMEMIIPGTPPTEWVTDPVTDTVTDTVTDPVPGNTEQDLDQELEQE